MGGCAVVLGCVLDRVGQQVKALDLFAETEGFFAKAEPADNATGLDERYLGLAFYEEAISVLHQICGKAPNRVWACNELGDLLRRLGRNDERWRRWTRPSGSTPTAPTRWVGEARSC